MEDNKLKVKLLKTKEVIINYLNKVISYLTKNEGSIGQSTEDRETIVNQLNKAQRQIDDIKDMVESEEDYYNIIKEIEFSRRILSSAEILLLESYSVPLQ